MRDTRASAGRLLARAIPIILLMACNATASRDAVVERPGAEQGEPSPSDPAQPTPAQPKVVFLGDSLSAGLHLAADQAFPAVLQRRLAASKASFQLVNAGVSGDTTAGGLRRVDWLLKQKPNVMVIELGANDGMRGVPVADVEANLRAIITKLQAADVRVLLLGMRIPPNYGPEYVTAFEAIYPRLAQELHVTFVPFFMEGVAGQPQLNLADGIHPTPEGHERLANNLVQPLSTLLSP